MSGEGVHRAGPHCRRAAGVARHEGVLVGDHEIRREHASISGIAHQLGTTWNTVWSFIERLLQAMVDDEPRFTGVKRLGVDEHVWHHVWEFPIEDGGRGPKILTGMVDLTPARAGSRRHGCSASCPAGQPRPTATGSKSAVMTSVRGPRGPPWTRSTAKERHR